MRGGFEIRSKVGASRVRDLFKQARDSAPWPSCKCDEESPVFDRRTLVVGFGGGYMFYIVQYNMGNFSIRLDIVNAN